LERGSNNYYSIIQGEPVLVDAFKTFPNLLAPVKIRGTVFRSRMFGAPTGHTDITGTGQPGMDALMYFKRKAAGGAATITLGEVNVDPDERTFGRWPREILTPGNYNYPRIASAIWRHGAVPVLELQFTGVESKDRDLKRGEAWGPVDMDDYNGYRVRAMTEERLLEIIEGYGKAALAAKKAGFGMVTLHGGHGWGLQQFYSPSLNTRTDRWGGSTQNRCRLAVMALDEIRRVCGEDFPIEIRISGSEIIEQGYGIEEACRIAEQLDGHADIIHVSVGSINEFKHNEAYARTHVSMFYPQGVNVQYAAEIKKHVKNSLVAAVGGMSDPYFMEEILASGKADIVYMARALICDPDLPNKVRSGRPELIRHCMRCLNCNAECMHHGDFLCSLNPEICREREVYYSLPEAKRQKVLVIGGGIAGMQAALTAAKNGHEVILCEKSGEPGGAILCEKDVPFKENLRKYIELQKQLIANAPIDLRLNTEVTPDYAVAEKPDVIIAAVGADPVVPDIPGVAGANVRQAMEVFADPDLASGKSVILGAGFTGVELALYLLMKGRSVEVVEMLGDISDGGNDCHKMAVKDMVAQTGLNIRFHTKAVEITESGLRCEGPGGEMFIGADTVILAAGMRARSDLAQKFSRCAPLFYAVGDCGKPGSVMNANAAAYTVARYIGRTAFV